MRLNSGFFVHPIVALPAQEHVHRSRRVDPPYLQTDLGPHHETDHRVMPLADFISEVMTILQAQPDVTDVVVERCKPLRCAAETGQFESTFQGLNDAMSAARL